MDDSLEKILDTLLEITLEDAYEIVKDTKDERQLEVENLLDKIKNTKIDANVLNKDIAPEEIEKRQLIYINSLAKCIKEDIPRDYPLPNTIDMDESIIKELKQDLQSSKFLENEINEDIENYKRDINELNKKINGLEDMEEAYFNAKYTEQFANYHETSKRIAIEFRNTKEYLGKLVSIIFPENAYFEDLLADLTRAYTTGGDNVYIEVKNEHRSYISFLVETDLVAYHPYNKHLIKLVDFL